MGRRHLRSHRDPHDVTARDLGALHEADRRYEEALAATRDAILREDEPTDSEFFVQDVIGRGGEPLVAIAFVLVTAYLLAVVFVGAWS